MTQWKSPAQKKAQRKERVVIGIIVGGCLALVFGLASLGIWAMTRSEDGATNSAATSNTVAPSTTPSTPTSTPVKPVVETKCTYGKPLKYEPREGVGDVVRPNDGAQYKFTDKQELLDAAAEDPVVLSAYLHEFMKETYPNGRDWKSLVNDQGNCLNQKGAEALEHLELAVQNWSMEIGEADASWVNTGGSEDGIVSNTTPGITGDRKAMIFEKNGKQVVILLRCGNPVHEAPRYPQKFVPQPPSGGGTPPPLPPTRTVTQPPPPPPTTTIVTPPPTTTLVPKPPLIIPGPQGGGRNEHDGPGESTIPDPPTSDTPDLDPPAPAPQPDPESTPDPDPAPAPEAGTGSEEIIELPGTGEAEDGTAEFQGEGEQF